MISSSVSVLSLLCVSRVGPEADESDAAAWAGVIFVEDEDLELISVVWD